MNLCKNRAMDSHAQKLKFSATVIRRQEQDVGGILHPHLLLSIKCRRNFSSTLCSSHFYVDEKFCRNFAHVFKMSLEFFIDILLLSVKCQWNFPLTSCSCHFYVDKNFCRHPTDMAQCRRKIPWTCYGQKQKVGGSNMWAPVTLSPLK